MGEIYTLTAHFASACALNSDRRSLSAGPTLLLSAPQHRAVCPPLQSLQGTRQKGKQLQGPVGGDGPQKPPAGHPQARYLHPIAAPASRKPCSGTFSESLQLLPGAERRPLPLGPAKARGEGTPEHGASSLPAPQPQLRMTYISPGTEFSLERRVHNQRHRLSEEKDGERSAPGPHGSPAALPRARHGSKTFLPRLYSLRSSPPQLGSCFSRTVREPGGENPRPGRHPGGALQPGSSDLPPLLCPPLSPPGPRGGLTASLPRSPVPSGPGPRCPPKRGSGPPL